MIYTLFAYTIVATISASASSSRIHEWRPMAEIQGTYYKVGHPENISAEERCHKVAKELKLQTYKCIKTK